MAKVAISQPEFNRLEVAYKAPKEGSHIKWREFADHVDEAFTTKGLEKNIDCEVGVARTSMTYGRKGANDDQKEIVAAVLEDFKAFVRKNRLDAKSFFQDFDHHKHFKVSPKVFQQVLTCLNFPLSSEQLEAVTAVYGNIDNEIEYTKFLNDSNVLEYIINAPTTGAKSTYVEKFTDFRGELQQDGLVKKIQDKISAMRVRLLEFFQDHDILRKGYVPKSKFRSVIYA